MTERCINCGADLVIVQRFCRFCGKPTGRYDEESTPTQVMPPDPTAWRRGNTAPAGATDTAPVFQQPYYPQPWQYPAAQYPPREKRRGPLALFLVLIGMGFIALVALIIAVAVFSNRGVRVRPPVPAPPAIVAGTAAGETMLNEEGAVVSGRETALVRLFDLNPDAKFSLTNISGDIIVETWDEPRAEVRITKRGGSTADRRRVGIAYSTADGNLALRTAPERSTRVQVQYHIKLPRTLAQADINGISSSISLSDLTAPVVVATQSGSIKIADIKGDVSASTQSGSISVVDAEGEVSASTKSGNINLDDIRGSIRADSISGDIKAVLAGVTKGKPLDFKSVSGDIDLELSTALDADLEAKTVSGSVDLSDLGIEVEKRLVGARASGRVGSGGQPLSLATVSGDIRVTK